jgi:hypothetical protein
LGGSNEQLRIARLENRARVAEAHARVDSAIATAGLGSIHALRGSASPQVQQIVEAIPNAIARAEAGRSRSPAAPRGGGQPARLSRAWLPIASATVAWQAGLNAAASRRAAANTSRSAVWAP